MNVVDTVHVDMPRFRWNVLELIVVLGDAVLAELIESLKKGILGSNSQSMDCLCSVLVIVIHHSLVEDIRLFLLEQDTRTRVGHVR